MWYTQKVCSVFEWFVVATRVSIKDGEERIDDILSSSSTSNAPGRFLISLYEIGRLVVNREQWFFRPRIGSLTSRPAHARYVRVLFYTRRSAVVAETGGPRFDQYGKNRFFTHANWRPVRDTAPGRVTPSPYTRNVARVRGRAPKYTSRRVRVARRPDRRGNRNALARVLVSGGTRAGAGRRRKCKSRRIRERRLPKTCSGPDLSWNSEFFFPATFPGRKGRRRGPGGSVGVYIGHRPRGAYVRS